MTPFERCPVCGGEMVRKRVEKILRGGNHTAVMAVDAEVCQHCGERLFDQQNVQRFEQIRLQLERHETQGLTAVGHNYKVQGL